MCRWTLALSLLAASVAPASAAQAKYDPLGTGATTLTLDRSFLALLKKDGVKVEALAPARMKAGTVTFPVSGGKFDPLAAKGTVEHEGALVFKAGKRRVPLRALQLKTTQHHSPFAVKVGGGQLKLGRADSLSVSRKGFGDKITVRSLTLAPKVATRLGKKLHLKHVFNGGLPIGRSTTTTRPLTVAVVDKGKATLVLDPGFAAKLNSLFVAVNPIFPAEHAGAEFTSPILGGSIAPNASRGLVELGGALEFLQQAGGQLFWREPWVDVDQAGLSAEADVQPSPPYPGKIGRVAIAALTASAPAAASPRTRAVTVSDALSLAPAMAATMNELFAKPQGKSDVFVADEPMASLSFVAQGQ